MDTIVIKKMIVASLYLIGITLFIFSLVAIWRKQIRKGFYLAIAAVAMFLAPTLYYQYIFRDRGCSWPVFINAAVVDNTCLKIDYSGIADKAASEGAITLRVSLTPDGKITSQDIIHASGSPEFDKATIEGLKKCTFKTNGLQSYTAFIYKRTGRAPDAYKFEPIQDPVF